MSDKQIATLLVDVEDLHLLDTAVQGLILDTDRHQHLGPRLQALRQKIEAARKSITGEP